MVGREEGMVSSFEEGDNNESLMVGKLMLDWLSASVCEKC